MAISHVELHVPEAFEIGALARAFPAIRFVCTAEASAGAIDGEAWRAEAFDFWAFDRELDRLATRGAPLAITVSRDAFAITTEILTRAQRTLPRRNPASETTWFGRVLDVLAAMHDLTKPMVRADFDHALDTWQWSMRLDAGASGDVQLAALCHDIDASYAAAMFTLAGVPSGIAEGALAAIAGHEHTPEDPVADADALSFFSLTSHGYLRDFGARQTARRVAHAFRRLSVRARRQLAYVRLAAPVAAQLADLDRASYAS